MAVEAFLLTFILITCNVVYVSEKESKIMFGVNILLIISFLWLCVEADEAAYKRGQIDALNGEYKYEMKIKQDTIYELQESP